MSQRDKEAPAQSEAPERSKVDVSKLISIIPPASELKAERKVVSEKRVRIRFDRGINKPIAKLPSHLAKELGIKSGDTVEVIVAGRKKASFTAEVIETQENFVLVYPADLERQGVSDNSIATIRKSRGA